MFYADQVGLKKVYDRVCEFEKQHGARFAPADLIRRLAGENRGFYESFPG